MPGSNIGPALGVVAETFANRLQQKHKEERDDELSRFKLISGAITAGMETGRVDPNEGMKYLLENGPGKSGKGGKGKDGKNGLPGPLQTLLGGIMKAGGQGQAPPPKFLSNQQLGQQQDDRTLALKKREMTEITAPEKRQEEAARLKEIEARLGPVDKATQTRAQQLAAAAGDPENWPNYIQPAAQAIRAEGDKKNNAPRSALEKRAYDLAKEKGFDYNALTDVQRRGIDMAAGQLIESERAEKQQQSRQRLSATLAMSRASLATNQERLSEMRELFPYTVAIKQTGADIADARLAIDQYKVANPGGAGKVDPAAKASAAQQKSAASVVAAATKLAKSTAGKQSSILMGLGLENDEATIRTELIRELSGGEDPATVEAQARANVAPVKPPAAAHKVGDVVQTKDGSKHKIMSILPNGKIALDPTPVP